MSFEVALRLLIKTNAEIFLKKAFDEGLDTGNALVFAHRVEQQVQEHDLKKQLNNRFRNKTLSQLNNRLKDLTFS